MAENAEGDLNSNLLHAPYRTGDPQLDTAIGQWLRWDKVGTWSAWHPLPPPTHSPPFPVPTGAPQASKKMASATTGVGEPGIATHLCLGCLPPGAWAGQGHLQSLPFAVRSIAAPLPPLSHPLPPLSSSSLTVHVISQNIHHSQK